MKQLFSILLITAWLGGCTLNPAPGASDPAEFTWYHPQGGEFLFAFDQRQCEDQLVAVGQRLGSDVGGPFFSCMRARGYALIDAQGRLLSSVDRSVDQAPKVSQQ